MGDTIKIYDFDVDAIKVGSADVEAVYVGDTKVYPPYHDYSQDYLTFVARESGTFRLSGNSINYSLDNGATWRNLASNTNSPTVASGSKIMWRARLTPTSGKGIGRFYSSAQFNVEGNPMSLLYGSNFRNQTSLSGKNYAFQRLFSGNTNVVSAENISLPATTLANSCYYGMFYECSNLIAIPTELPATTLTYQCYRNMFGGCTSLTNAENLILPAATMVEGCYMNMFIGCSSLVKGPDLTASTLATQCYQGLFNNCTSLNYIKCLATDISATNCTSSWVTNVPSSGTFVKAVCMASWPSGASGIPNNWTVIDVQSEDCPAYTLLEGVERKTDYLGRLDLGLSVDTDFKIEVTLMYKNFVGGTFIGIDNTFRWFKATQNSQEKAFFDYNGQRISGLASTYGMENNTIFTLTLENYSMKSDLKTSSVTGSTQTSYTPSGNLCLFSTNITTGGDQGIVYGVKVYTNNASTLIGDFIPVRRNSDNLVTMYNTVTNTFCNVSGILYGVET